MPGRPESPLDPSAGPAARLALELRKLRATAGSPTYRTMAQRTGHGASTLSQAAAGERLPTLPVVLAYVQACGGDPQEWEERWRQAAADEAAEPRAEDDAAPPYRGLARFEPGDAAVFFGRDRLIDRLAELTRRQRFTAVFGPSGSGKSSLLRAGLIPRLRHTDDPDTRPAALRVLTPGDRPLRTHEKRLVPKDADGDTWLVVDQFEELYTLCHDPVERDRFIDCLLAATHPAGRLRVILAVRADFVGRCAEHPGLAAALQEATVLVGPMSPAELRQAIVKPARTAGLIVERPLTARLIDEVAGEPGALPLMSHALLETWRRRQGRALTEAAYEAAGGLHGAITRTAEDLYARLTPARTDLARRLLLRLVTPGDGAPDTRRPTPRTELGVPGESSEIDELLDQLARARLVTLDEDVVDLAHEALLTAWPRLHRWVEEDRERLRAHRRLTEAATAWQDLRRDPGALYRGTRLTTATDLWPPSRHGELTECERAFLAASVAMEEREHATAVKRQRRLRFLAACLTVLLVAVTGVSVVALRQRQDAEQARQLALSRQLAAQALELVASRPGTAMLLSVEAYRTAPTPEARSALLTMSAHEYYRTAMAGHRDAVSQIAFGPDGTLASVSADQTAALWDARRSRRLATLTGHHTWLRAVTFSPDGRLLATGGDDRAVVLWNTATHQRLATLGGHSGRIEDLAFAPDGRTLAAADARGTVTLWDTRRRSRLRTLSAHTGSVNAVAFSPDGRTLATAGDDRTVRLWSLPAGRQQATLTGHSEPVDDVAFSPDGRLLATAGQDHTARLWDLSRRTPLATFTGHTGQVRAVAFSPDGRTLATGGHDETVMLWDVEHRTQLATLTGHNSNIYTLAFNPRGTLLASAGEDGTITVWDPHRIPLTGHTDRVNAVAFSPDGRTLATGSDDRTAILWDVERRSRRATLSGGTGPVNAAAFAPHGCTLATATGTPQHPQAHDFTLTLWTCSHPRDPRRLTGHTDRVMGVVYHPDGHTAATVSADQTIRLWDTRRGTCLAVLRNDPEDRNISINGVAFSPNGRLLATVDHAHRVRLWDVATRRRLATLVGHTGSLRAVAFSPDGRTLATAGVDETVLLWDVATRRRLATLTGHTGVIHDVAFSPDGRMLATAGGDRSVVLWDLARRTPAATLTGHTRPVRSVAFSPDGRTLATGSDDHTALLWNTDPRRTAAQLCASLARNLTPQEWQQFIPGTAYHKTCPDAPPPPSAS